MQPHIKLLHIITATTTKKCKALMVKHREDKMLGDLIELMCSPEYKHNYSITVLPPRPQPTSPTEETFIKFRSLLYTQDTNLQAYLETLDSATRFVYTCIANQVDLEIPFKFIADTFNLFNRFNYNEHYIDYGFPELPCHIQVLPKDRLMINLKVGHTVTATYLDGRYYKEIDVKILEQIKELYLTGDFTGYIEEGTYYITNYYPKGDATFSKRILLVETALLRCENLTNVGIAFAFTLTNIKFLEKYLVKDHEIICKQDILPIFGKSNKMISLDCNKYIKLKEIKEEK